MKRLYMFCVRTTLDEPEIVFSETLSEEELEERLEKLKGVFSYSVIDWAKNMVDNRKESNEELEEIIKCNVGG